MSTLFQTEVPGRICLVGEHCDYAKGMSVALPIDKKITAYGQPRKDNIISLTSALDDEALRLQFSLDDIVFSEEHPLRYSAALIKTLVAHRYSLGGMSLLMDSNLPSKKGLASSAAVSVATAELFNLAFHLGLSRDKLAALAYESEHDLLHIGCGKMDQLAVAYRSLISLDFRNQQEPKVTELHYLGDSMHFLIGVPVVTKRAIGVILSASNKAYSSPTTARDLDFKRALDTHIPNEVVLPFITALQHRDKKTMGACLRRNQQIYDQYFVPICESFEAPLLHQYLQIARDNGSLGEKWTGAGGEGAFICLTDSVESRDNLQRALEKKSPIDIHFVTATI